MGTEHKIPAVDRAMAIMDALGRHAEGLTLVDLARECDLSRSTVYRIVNSLQAANLIRRARQPGHFALGSGLLGLASNVRRRFHELDLVPISHPHLEELTRITGEASKLSVLDGQAVVCIDAVAGTNDYSVSPIVGQSFPIHAGAASKVLLAGMSPEARAVALAEPLDRFSENTITDCRQIDAELSLINESGWAQDRGEHSPTVRALAAPVHDGTGQVVAAVSLVYLAEKHDQLHPAHLDDLLACCRAISQALAAPG